MRVNTVPFPPYTSAWHSSAASVSPPGSQPLEASCPQRHRWAQSRPEGPSRCAQTADSQHPWTKQIVVFLRHSFLGVFVIQPQLNNTYSCDYPKLNFLLFFFFFSPFLKCRQKVRRLFRTMFSPVNYPVQGRKTMQGMKVSSVFTLRASN